MVFNIKPSYVHSHIVENIACLPMFLNLVFFKYESEYFLCDLSRTSTTSTPSASSEAIWSDKLPVTPSCSETIEPSNSKRGDSGYPWCSVDSAPPCWATSPVLLLLAGDVSGGSDSHK